MKKLAKSGIGKAHIRSYFVTILVGIFALLAVCPTVVYANPPKEVTLVYNTGTQMLEVTIEHNSASPTWHYINKVEIKKNGTSVNTNEYTSQPDKSKFVYSYPVQAAKGDVLEVTATCNIYGSKTVKLTVDK
jgi:desulfoferrodoxin (superoxide reductase-like protein)